MDADGSIVYSSICVEEMPKGFDFLRRWYVAIRHTENTLIDRERWPPWTMRIHTRMFTQSPRGTPKRSQSVVVDSMHRV